MGEDEKFTKALKGKHISPLTLDNKWHKLFKKTDAEESAEMKELEVQLNELLKRQGKINSELKDLHRIKSNLMDEIVTNMNGVEDGADKAAQKKIEESKRLINEINERVEGYQDEALDLPRLIDDVNYKLMLLTMQECYTILQDNTADIDRIGRWIKEMRVELKRKILEKQKMEIKNVELYSYMHDIFGSDVVDIFDIKYDVEKQRQDILDRQAAIREEKARQGGSN